MVTEEKRISACLSPDMEARFKHLWHLVGNTPMLELHYTYRGEPGKVYVKCENYNLTGSIKDRIALYVMYQAYRNCKIKPGDTIIEAASGNTGISFSAIGRALGHPVKIIMPNWLSKERIAIIESMGAGIILVSKEQGGFPGCIRLAERMEKEGKHIFLPRQFENRHNAEAHEKTTGKEIWRQLATNGMIADAFVAGVGTGGTVMGVGGYLKMLNPKIKVHPIEPAESPTLTTGYKAGTHRIQGISDEFISEIVKLDQLDEVIQVNDGDSIIMAQKLAEQLGLAVGISSGANVIGAIKLKDKMRADAIVVTVLSDNSNKYLSTDLTKDEPIKETYISPGIIFTGYHPISRLTNEYP